MTGPALPPPYRSQFASPDWTDEIVRRSRAVADDPRWAESGARSPEEYEFWAKAGCGMACLQMILEATTGAAPPLVTLAEGCESYGGYRRRGTPDQGVDGLLYDGFVRYIEAEHGLHARVAAPLPLDELVASVTGGEFVLASVHHAIRWPERTAPGQGGHLVLVYGADQNNVHFNNPSGHLETTQRGVALAPDAFARFYAQRGVAVRR